MAPYLSRAEQLEAEVNELRRSNRRLRGECWTQRAITLLMAVALVLLLSAVTFGQATFRRAQTETEAMQVALADLRTRPAPFAMRYLWLPQSSPRRIGGARFVLNSTINRTDRGVTVQTLDEGRILAVNLLDFSRDFAEFVELSGLWELLADRDFFFHERNQLVPALVIQGPAQLEASGKALCSLPAGFVVTPGDDKAQWVPCRLVGRNGHVRRSSLKLVNIAPFAAHVAAEMAELQSLTGSRAAFLRADDFVRLAYSTVDEGIYYELLGIAGLSLEQIMERAGANKAELDKRNPLNWGGLVTSLVTGEERAYVVGPALGASPDKSRGIFGLTFDFRNDNRQDDPLGTLFFFLLKNRFDAGEGVFILPNGFPYGILYNGDGKLQDVAPPEIATDPHDRSPHHQLQAGISCNRCHELWWKDAGNNVRWTLNNGLTRGGIYGLADPAFVGLSQEQIFARLSGAYRASIIGTLDESRRTMAAQIAGTCGIPAKDAIEGATELWESASYGDVQLAADNWAVSPALVMAWHGVEVVGNPTPLELRAAFDAIFPAPDVATGVVEFPEISSWRLWDAPDAARTTDAPQPRFEQLRRSFTYLASLRNLQALEEKP